MPHIFAGLEQFQDLLDCRLLLFQLLHLETLTSSPRLLADVLMCLFNKFNVLDSKFFTDDVQIPNRVDVTLNVNDLCIVETPHYLKDGVDGANV